MAAMALLFGQTLDRLVQLSFVRRVAHLEPLDHTFLVHQHQGGNRANPIGSAYRSVGVQDHLKAVLLAIDELTNLIGGLSLINAENFQSLSFEFVLQSLEP